MGLGSHGIFVPGHKFRGLGLILLELLGLGQKSLGQSRDFELLDPSPWDRNRWDWQFRAMPMLV